MDDLDTLSAGNRRAAALVAALRASYHLDAPVVSPALIAAARIQVAACVAAGTPTHTGPAGAAQLQDRLRLVGYTYRWAEENAAVFQPSVEAAVEAWKASPRHLANLIGPVTEMGLAWMDDVSGRPYYVLVMADPLPDMHDAMAPDLRQMKR